MTNYAKKTTYDQILICDADNDKSNPFMNDKLILKWQAHAQYW